MFLIKVLQSFRLKTLNAVTNSPIYVHSSVSVKVPLRARKMSHYLLAFQSSCLTTFLKAAVRKPYFSMLRDGKGANANNGNRPIEDGRLRTGVNVITLRPVE